jgi:hypothetical protein
VIGRQRALMLCTTWPAYQAGGGRRVSVYVPRKLPDGHRLVAIIGPRAAVQLVEAFGGETLQLPAVAGRLGLAARREFIVDEHMRGKTTSEIARLAGIDPRSVRRIVADATHGE